ncbi:MAG: HAMP domain-containing sensor histidine kinase, partial [Acidobacteria bacterium]|nr:HAMP domain-containing sensor histidine kinase [Acidobacteriota bacterium]
FQLTAFLALSIALVIGTTTYLQFRVVEGTLDTELVDAARLTALAVADDLELRRGPFDPEEIRRHLQEFIDTAPELGSISVVTLDHGQPVLFASTSSAGRTDALDVGRRAIARRDIVWGNPTGPVRVLAVPLTRDQRTFGAVAVTVSFDALYRLRDRGRVIAAWSTVLSVLALFVLVEFLVRWFIHRPIDAIRATMRHVTGGTLSARTPVLRDDEIGAVASGLNHMLAEMEELHGGLQQRVGQATQEIRARNRELLELYRQMSQLREELGRAQQLAAVGETASAVAHQIGTPLNLVSGHIQLLMEGLDPASPVARRLQVAEEQLHKVTAIVQDLLARSRRPLQREPVDLDLLLRRLCALVKPVHDTAGVRLTYEGAPVPAVDADAAQLELALLNLVSNAIDAMPAGGELVIRLAAADSHATISVSDTGTGMPPDLVERAFEPWVTTKPVGRGTGLGLSITRSVIVDHGGSVAVRSAVGRGTTVTVTLPLASAATPPKTNHA